VPSFSYRLIAGCITTVTESCRCLCAFFVRRFIKINGKCREPQHMLMRVSVGIHLDDLESVLETYDLMSKSFLHMLHLHYSTQVHQNLKCLLVSFYAG
jgi:hypothetical protein